MAEDKPSLHVDSDWKKQAAEEKRKLAEQEAQRRAQQQAAPPAPAGVIGGAAASAARGQGSQRGREREMPEASIGTLVQTLSTQALIYMGQLATRGSEPMVNLDMARHQVDMLALLQDKTRGNLTPDEKSVLDNVVYEISMRFVSVAQQYAELP